MIKRTRRHQIVLVKGYGIRKRIQSGHGIKEVLTSIFSPLMNGVNFLNKNKDAVKQAIDTVGNVAAIGQNAKRVVDEIRKRGINKESLDDTINDPAIRDLIKKIKAIKVGQGFAYI